MQEIERKYLVRDDSFRREAHEAVEIAQGYICRRRITARVRLWGEQGVLTIKGRSRDGGLSRFEFERTIPASCARHLLARCTGVVEKVRYMVDFEGFRFEVDEFKGENRGLVIAEVELAHRDQKPHLPEWIWREVTGCRYYYNSYLSAHPYSQWNR